MHPKHLFRLLPIAIVLGMSIGFGWQYFQEQQATRLDYDHPSPLPTQPKKTIRAKRNPSAPQSEVWQVVTGSVYDGDTLRLKKGHRILKIRLCGMDAPETKQPRGMESRDTLKALIAKGDGTVIVTPVENDRYGRLVAELFVQPRPGTGYQEGEEIFLNAEMVKLGLAYDYKQFSGRCPNGDAIAQAEEIAQASKVGVWSDSNSVKPWDWRRVNR